MTLDASRPCLKLHECITNEAGESMDFMWGHHPAFGAPFLSPACRIDVGAQRVWADDVATGPTSPLAPDSQCSWPLAERDGVITDLSLVTPPDAPRHLLACLHDFESGWFAITNSELAFGVGVTWPVTVFPYAWLWEEIHASAGYPWYKGAYVIAVEPQTSIPPQGLAAVIAKSGTHRSLGPRESIEAELVAVFYEGTAGVQKIHEDGTVVLK